MKQDTEVYLVVGGEGFLGRRIVEALIEQKSKTNPGYKSSEIRVADLRMTYPDPTGYEFYQADICNKERLIEIIKTNGSTVTTVFHTASPIMKAPKELHKKVNIDGTKSLLEACEECGIKNFIYTSSASVVYSGKPLVNVDETIPYANPFADYYSETKAVAEKMCLEANSPNGMKVVALRPSGIFGPGDRQTTPGALIAQKKGYPVLFQVGSNTALFDFTYVDNLVDAHLAASNKLIEGSDIGGNVFFITNDQPIGMWSFLRMIWAGVGDTREPKIIIPDWLAAFILVALNLLSSVGLIKHEIPFVFGMTFTDRYFNINKAKKLLDYKPTVSYKEGVPLAVASTLNRWKEEEKQNKTN
ncbi:hypothetical protein BB558_004719 [Smittium angustum]|uniref:3-beta hydroxysteroid dehydrogenase/isomerase domain-containing protein n=1 Tax=Smittium angustum TaxID=133377 RepID=A0A2U1J2L3_SMIAN|nr:hypothetical protein BB558_004719 [Smittium angustum]